MQLLTFCFCTSLAITAIHTVVTRPGMLLYGVSQMFERVNMYSWVTNPLYNCMICMSSLWTTIFWLAALRPVSLTLLFAILIVWNMMLNTRCLLYYHHRKIYRYNLRMKFRRYLHK